jgi:hypothetical protein
VARSVSKDLLVCGDAIGRVKLFKYPCANPRAEGRIFKGHSNKVSSVSFTAGDNYLLSTSVGSANARGCTFQWLHVSVEHAQWYREHQQLKRENEDLAIDIKQKLKHRSRGGGNGHGNKRRFFESALESRALRDPGEYKHQAPEVNRNMMVLKSQRPGSMVNPGARRIRFADDFSQDDDDHGREEHDSGVQQQGSPSGRKRRGGGKGKQQEEREDEPMWDEGMSRRIERVAEVAKTWGGRVGPIPFNPTQKGISAQEKQAKLVRTKKRYASLVLGIKTECAQLEKQLIQQKTDIRRKGNSLRQLTMLNKKIEGMATDKPGAGKTAKARELKRIMANSAKKYNNFLSHRSGGDGGADPNKKHEKRMQAAAEKRERESMKEELKRLEQQVQLAKDENDEVTGQLAALYNQNMIASKMSAEFKQLRATKLMLRKALGSEASQHNLEVYQQENYVKECLFNTHELQRKMEHKRKQCAELEAQVIEANSAQGMLDQEYHALQEKLDAMATNVHYAADFEVF